MATNFSTVKDKIQDDILTCSLCFEIFKIPKVLPCLHSFCQHCLESWVHTNAGKLECPMCRLEVPNNEIATLQTNFILTGLHDYLVTVKELEKENKCGACEQAVAITRCLDCTQNLCETCTTGHRNLTVTRRHKVIDLVAYTSGAKISQPTVYCERHHKRPVELYCETCQTPICKECTYMEHSQPNHHHKSLNQAAQDSKQHLLTLIRELRSSMISVDETTNMVSQELKNLQLSHDKVDRMIDDHVQKTINDILEKQTKLKKELSQIYENKNHSLESQKQELATKKATLESAKDYAENLIKYASPSQYLKSMKSLIERAEHVLTNVDEKPNVDGVIIFHSNKNLADEEIGQLACTKPIMHFRARYHRKTATT